MNSASVNSKDSEMAEHDPQFPIPDPGKPDLDSPINQLSLAGAALEQKQLSGWWSPKWLERYDWAMRYVLRPVIFVVIVWLNIWWDVNVRDILWQAGRTGSGFHLENSVLIALITTSMANFLALVAIVARHLFPDSKH
jgi:hypothetical protein